MSWHCLKCDYPNPDSLNACFKCGSVIETKSELKEESSNQSDESRGLAEPEEAVVTPQKVKRNACKIGAVAANNEKRKDLIAFFVLCGVLTAVFIVGSFIDKLKDPNFAGYVGSSLGAIFVVSIWLFLRFWLRDKSETNTPEATQKRSIWVTVVIALFCLIVIGACALDMVRNQQVVTKAQQTLPE